MLKRLVRADSDRVRELLMDISDISLKLHDVNLELVEKLEIINREYPDLYKKLDMVVKLPVRDRVLDFTNGLTDILDHFDYEGYLDNYVGSDD